MFYYQLKRLKAKDKYAGEKEMIKSIFHDHKGRYGYRRITEEMRNNDVVLNHKTVRRLMVQMGLKSQIRKVRYRSYKGEVGGCCKTIIDKASGNRIFRKKPGILRNQSGFSILRGLKSGEKWGHGKDRSFQAGFCVFLCSFMMFRAMKTKPRSISTLAFPKWRKRVYP